MDQSTENVTLLVAFYLDVLREAEPFPQAKAEMLKICQGIDLANPYGLAPIEHYNAMCQYMEDQLGRDLIVKIGRNVGDTVHGSLVENGIISAEAEPLEILDGLVLAASSLIHDDKGRGWEMLDSPEPNSQVMRRTQTFNRSLQFGLLEGLVRKAPGVERVEVRYLRELARGAEFDDYLVRWF